MQMSIVGTMRVTDPTRTVAGKLSGDVFYYQLVILWGNTLQTKSSENIEVGSSLSHQDRQAGNSIQILTFSIRFA